MNENTNNEPTVRDVLKDLQAHEKVCDARHAAIQSRFSTLEKLFYAVLAMQTATVLALIGGAVWG